MAQERANALKDQFIMDMHTHFLRDDTRIMNFVAMRNAVGKAGWNKELAGKEQTIDDLKFGNYIKEIFLDSDTKIALISSAPSDIEQDWFLTNEQMARGARQGEQGGRLPSACSRTSIFTPGQPGWLEQLDAGARAQARFAEGLYDRRQHPQGHQPLSLAHGRREGRLQGLREIVKAGIKNVCVHKGLFPPSVEKQFPHLRGYADVSRRRAGGEGLAAAQLHHLPRRLIATSAAIRRWRWPNSSGPAASTGPPISPTSRRSTASTMSMPTSASSSPPRWSSQPRVCAALMGILIKGLGVDHVNWGTDAVWTGSPQWQIEGLRRLEIPEDMQKKYGFAPLGAANGPVKTAIFGGNNARLYGIDPKKASLELKGDRFAAIKAEYEKNGPEPSHTRYGYVTGPIDHAVFA